MSTITLTLDVPDGTTFTITTNQPEQAGISTDILEAISRLVPARYQGWLEEYLNKAINDLGCTVEFPNSTKRKFEYINVFPPARCRRKVVSGITLASTRTALRSLKDPIDLSGYKHAVETYNSGVYAYPKVPHLDSAEAVEEALMLLVMAIQQAER